MESNMKIKHEAKKLRYENLSTKIAVETVQNMPFEIGALGGIEESYKRLMCSLGVRRHDAKRIGGVLSKEALRSSKAILLFEIDEISRTEPLISASRCSQEDKQSSFGAECQTQNFLFCLL